VKAVPVVLVPVVLVLVAVKVAADRAKVEVRAVALAIAKDAAIRGQIVAMASEVPPMPSRVAAVAEANVVDAALVADLPRTTAIRKTTRKAKRK
jgi:hypothetical protein